MFKPSICTYSTRSQMTLDTPLHKTKTGKKSSSFLGPKIWSKINPSTKKHSNIAFIYACSKEKYFTSSANIS